MEENSGAGAPKFVQNRKCSSKCEKLTNSALDTGVVSERKNDNCTKELELQFSSSNSSDETER